MTQTNAAAVTAAPRKTRRPKRLAARIAVCAVAAIFALILVFPYVFMLSKSLMSGTEAGSFPVRLFPQAPTIDAYIRVFSAEQPYLRYTWNSLKIILFNIIAIPLSASLVAYGFAKTNFFGKKFLFALMLSTMLLPTMVLQIPQFVLFTRLGWYDSIWPLTVPNLLGGGAANIFLIRQFMRGIPNSLEDAARIDGANAFTRYLMITLPLCKAVLIYMMVTVFNAYWSDFYGPLIYLDSSDKYTLAIGIFKDASQNASIYDTPNLMAAGVFMTLFPAILFAVFQKQLIEGVNMAGIKG